MTKYSRKFIPTGPTDIYGTELNYQLDRYYKKFHEGKEVDAFELYCDLVQGMNFLFDKYRIKERASEYQRTAVQAGPSHHAL